MAGGLTRFRHLGRTSAHRQALLRNLVTSLVKNESIHTTWHKAKEAQRLAEKLITLAKRNNETARRAAQGIIYTPDRLMPKLFGELRERYAERSGGYTRVLRTETKNPFDQSQSAILELVDGPADLRFTVTAAAVARDREMGKEHNDLTERNMKKVTQFRKGGVVAFEEMVQKVQELNLTGSASEREEKEPYYKRIAPPRKDYARPWVSHKFLRKEERRASEP
ncbi:ribosomal protein L17 [Coniochaeta sp. 2T2.1]|nr:ribosomal protein L17 [Coniochaeta sp. 2T2.1]